MSRFLPEAAIMKLFMNTHNVRLPGRIPASDLGNIHGALIIAGIQPAGIPARAIQPQANRELPGSGRSPRLAPEAPKGTVGGMEVVHRNKAFVWSEAYFESPRWRPTAPLNTQDAVANLPPDPPLLDTGGHRRQFGQCRLVVTGQGRCATLPRSISVFLHLGSRRGISGNKLNLVYPFDTCAAVPPRNHQSNRCTVIRSQELAIHLCRQKCMRREQFIRPEDPRGTRRGSHGFFLVAIETRHQDGGTAPLRLC